MLHHHHNQIQTQTLLLSTSSFISPFHSQSQSQSQSPPPSSSSSTSSYYSPSYQVEREKRMESSAVAAEFSFYFGSRGIQGQETGGFDGFGSCDDMAWVVEKGNVLGLGDDFVVDDLLDFGQLETTQTEAEGEDDDDNTNNKEEEEEEEHQNRNKKHREIQQQQHGKEESLGEDNSAVSFEPIPMPVSELTLPAHDAAELEWVSRIMDDSLLEFQTYSAPKPYFPPQHMHMHMPMTMTMPMPMLTIPVKAKRSKRARSMSWSSSCSSSSSWGSGVPLLFIDSSSSTTTSSASSSSCSSSSYSSSSFKQQQQQQQFILGHQVCDEIPVSVYPHHPPHNYNYGSKILNCVTLKKQKAKKKGKGKGKGKKRGRKPKKSVVVVVVVGEGGGIRVERQCRHCGVNKTPQWRTGPEGAKTLCNACGVRYKSGRLLPEYRPACSPSFLNHVHSNSHRKVIEMRRNKGEEQEQHPNHNHLSSTFPLPASFSSSTTSAQFGGMG